MTRDDHVRFQVDFAVGAETSAGRSAGVHQWRLVHER
jgi:hypothetical protein